ncbi:hypothetical protein, partial [Streptomyces bacillaris]|uniref:hypothetical protein n=1 Tax=Streptomyces bacillaris TaxID=68179 RepID=UPI0037FF744A
TTSPSPDKPAVRTTASPIPEATRRSFAGQPLGLLVGTLAALGLVGYGFSTLSGTRRPPGTSGVARGAAALSAAACAGLYVWGAAHLFLDETGTSQACQSAASSSEFSSVNRYSVSYLPPSLSCHLADGRSYDAAVPSYVAPAMTGSVIAVTLTIIATVESRHSNRHHARKEKKL